MIEISDEVKRVKHIPHWLLEQEGITARQWKQQKRRELRALRKAFEAYRQGSAYTPATNGEVGRINEAIKSLERELSRENWGR